ncbi:MAG TPA: peptidoglycan DD-metalloendopeptidase family protein [Candidatus Dormibacteraeota bacterium]|nr:peptidoglycan DD-metalloendopeptidase family protein [Candidatus Dormibacteraeota bacterium]
MRQYRYVSHGLVVLIAVAISGYGAADLGLTVAARAGALSAPVPDDGGSLGNLAIGRDSVIIKPVSIPTSALPNRRAIVYRVKDGDTLDSISHGFGITLRELIWSNPGLRLTLKLGQPLDLPPMPGVVLTVKPGDSAASLASRYGVDPTDLLGFNSLRPEQLAPGMKLVVPVDPAFGPNLPSGVAADPLYPGQLMCPIHGAPIIQKFGPTSFALEPPYDGYLHFHTGVDLLAGFGTPIVAAAGGKVTATGYADYFGMRVAITDSYGLVEIYAHMSLASTTVGQFIQQGQTVGFVGSTGLSIGAHLHLQLEVGGVPTDPGPLAGC